MIIIRNKIIPFKGYRCINLFGILFVHKDAKMNDVVFNHEKIHTAQMIEMLFIVFYLWYVIEYLIVRFFHAKQINSYHDISFEEEANNNEGNLNYLSTRKHYAWMQYIKIKSNELE